MRSCSWQASTDCQSFCAGTLQSSPLSLPSLLLEQLDQVDCQAQNDADQDDIKAEVSAGPHLQHMSPTQVCHLVRLYFRAILQRAASLSVWGTHAQACTWQDPSHFTGKDECLHRGQWAWPQAHLIQKALELHIIGLQLLRRRIHLHTR